MTRERFELVRDPRGFDVFESLYWSWLARFYWRLLHGPTVDDSRESQPGAPDVPEGTAQPEGSP